MLVLRFRLTVGGTASNRATFPFTISDRARGVQNDIAARATARARTPVRRNRSDAPDCVRDFDPTPVSVPDLMASPSRRDRPGGTTDGFDLSRSRAGAVCCAPACELRNVTSADADGRGSGGRL